MNWKSLKSNECPACGSYIEHPDENDMIYCTDGTCDFKIRAERYNEIVQEMKDEDGYKMYQ